MKSILFFNESLDGGGAEGVLENIVSSINPEAFKVYVVSETDNELRTATIKKHSRHHCFVHKNLSGSKIKEIFNKIIMKLALVLPPFLVSLLYIRRRCDIGVAFCEGYSTKLIGNSKGQFKKKIAWVHTDVVNNPWSERIFGSKEIERECYEKFDAIVCVSQTIKDSFIKKYGMEEKVHVIYNIIDDIRAVNLSKEKLDYEIQECPLFVLAGSFRYVKGYDRMVKACAKLRDLGYDFRVIIMGIGYERDEIEELLDEYKLRDKITLMDYQKNPYKFMIKADAFVCSSRAEGYSTVVAESVALNVPVITTECSGMREIFGGYECGIICENSEDGIFDSLKKVLDNPDLLNYYKSEEAVRAKEFSKSYQIKQVEKFFKELL